MNEYSIDSIQTVAVQCCKWTGRKSFFVGSARLSARLCSANACRAIARQVESSCRASANVEKSNTQEIKTRAVAQEATDVFVISCDSIRFQTTQLFCPVGETSFARAASPPNWNAVRSGVRRSARAVGADELLVRLQIDAQALRSFIEYPNSE